MVKDKHKHAESPAAAGDGNARPDRAPPQAGETASPPEIVMPAGAESAAEARTNAIAEAPPGPAEEDLATIRAAIAARGEELDAVRRELSDTADRHLRLAAEFDNYRKRVERERADLWSRAQAEIATRLLDTLDDLERVGHHTETATAQALHEGVQLIERKLRSTLAAGGLEEVAAENASFDPQVMEAVAVVAVDSPEEDDVVSDVFQKGYRFKGQLLRPARVRVKKHE